MASEKTKRIKADLAKYQTKKKSELTEVSELPGWVKSALGLMIFDGHTHESAARKFNRVKTTLESYSYSPAGRKWKEMLREVADDPQACAKAILGASAGGMAANLLWAIEAAVEAGDYKEVRIGTADIMDRFDVGVTKKGPEVQQPTIIFNIPAGAAPPEVIHVESEVIEDAPESLSLPEVPYEARGSAADERSDEAVLQELRDADGEPA